MQDLLLKKIDPNKLPDAPEGYSRVMVGLDGNLVVADQDRKETLMPSALVDANGAIAGFNFRETSISISKKPSNLITRIPGGEMNANAGTAAGNTWHVTAEMPSEFDWVQLVYRSIEPGAIVITSAAIGVNDGSVPYPGITGSLVPVTFGGLAKGTMPARIANGIPSYLFSDWIQVSSIPRVDSGTLPLVIGRTYFASPDGSGSGSGYSYSTRLTAGGLTDLLWKQSNQTVDGITNAAGFTNGVSGGNCVLQGIRTMSRYAACTVSFVGDSVQAGQGSTGGVRSAGYIACRNLSSLGKPVIYSGDSAWNGRNPATYWQIFNASVQQVKPRIAFYSVSSPNESVTSQAIQNKHFAYAMRFVQDCLENGVIPVLQTCYPQNRGTPALDAFRKGLNDRIRAYTESNKNVYFCDVDAAVADPAAPHAFLPAYNSGDNSHMSDAGYEAAAVPMEMLIEKIINL